MKLKKIGLLIFSLLLCGALFSCGSSSGSDTNPPNGGGGSQTQSGDQIYANGDRKIIYTVSYTISLDEGLGELADEVSDKIYSLNGYVSSSKETTNYYTYTYKVPVESLNDFLSFMSEKKDVIDSKTITSEDVTSSYNKLTAEISTLEASKAAYEKILLDETLSFSDIINIKNKIDSINSDLAYLYNQLDSINEKTDYATINITYQQKYTAPEENPFMDYLNYLQDLGMWVVQFILYTLPFALVSGIIITILYLVKRKRSKTTS